MHPGRSPRARRAGAIWSVGDGRFLLVPADKDVPGIELGQHWKCYDAVTFFDPEVTANLLDQFHGAENVVVGPGRFLCNPADKIVLPNPPELALLPDEHLACYEISDDPPIEPPHIVDDQFGTNVATVFVPELLCVPSLEFVPEPGLLVSFGSGLMLLGWLDRPRRRRAIGR